MKQKSNSKGLRVLSVLTALLLIAAATLYYVSGKLKERVFTFYDDVPYTVFTDLYDEVDSGGTPAIERADIARLMRDALGAEPAREAAEAMCAMLIDMNGTVIAETGELETGVCAPANLLLSRYERDSVFLETGFENAEIRRYQGGRLCLIVNETGAVDGRLIASYSQDAPSIIGTASKEVYDSYFPKIDGQVYKRLSGSYGGWGDGESEQSAKGKAEFEAVESYVKWEDEQIAKSSGQRVIMKRLQGEQSGRVLALFYKDYLVTDAVETQRQAAWKRFDECYLAFLICLIAYWIALAVWVFRDAKKRGFRPAMWALLTLIGNLVAFLVYRLVRPDRESVGRCPQCQTPIRPTFAFCPACGNIMRGRCSSCHHALETGWKVCPYCGTPVSGEGQGDDLQLSVQPKNQVL